MVHAIIVTHGGLLRALFAERFANVETRVSSVAALRQTLAVDGVRRTAS